MKKKNTQKVKVHVKTGDRVQVLNGKDKGAIGDVLKVFPKENRILVSDVNVVTKHQKPTQENQHGGIITTEGKIDASNVLLYCDTCGKGVRYKKEIDSEGKKIRVCKKCGHSLEA